MYTFCIVVIIIVTLYIQERWCVLQFDSVFCLQVNIEDTDVTVATCSSINDPHMKTFDDV